MSELHDYHNDIAAAIQHQEDVMMEEADDAAAFEEQHDEYLLSMDSAVDMHAFEKDRYEREMVAYLDNETKLRQKVPWDDIDEYEQSRAGQEWIRYKSSIIYGRLDTIQIVVEWPSQRKYSTFVRMQYSEALEMFEKGEAPVFDADEYPVPQDVWPGLRYSKGGVFASTLRFRAKYKEDKPESFLNMLPGELRQQIYNLVFADRLHQRYKGKVLRTDIRQLKEPSLSRAIPSLRPEILSYYVSKIHLSIAVYSKMMATGTITSSTRMRERAGRWGTGQLAVRKDHWLYNVHPDAIRFRNVMLHIEERDGASLLDLHLSFFKNKKARTPVVTILRGFRSYRVPVIVDARMSPSKRVAKDLVQKHKQNKDFPGFSFADLHEIANAFKDPEGNGGNKATQPPENETKVDTLRGMLRGRG